MDNSNVELITKMVLEAVEKKNAAQSGEGFLVPIGVSARHIHLTQEHVEILFGEGYHLTKFKELMGGQFASNEKVTIVGLKLRAIENVRVLGPVRKNTQVEISATDAISLGVKAPIRESGKYCRKRTNRDHRTKRCGVSERGMHCCEETYSHGSERCDGSRSS